jgi:threonine/homoserine/homoserine lactone efflux protein
VTKTPSGTAVAQAIDATCGVVLVGLGVRLAIESR